MFLETVVEEEWFVFEEFLCSEGLANSRSSFSKVGETNVEQMTLGGLEEWNRSWQSKEGMSGQFGRPNPPETIDRILSRAWPLQQIPARFSDYARVRARCSEKYRIFDPGRIQAYLFVIFDFLIVLGLYFRLF